MDDKRLVLMMMMLIVHSFIVWVASLVAATTINHSRWNPYVHTHQLQEDGLYDGHLYSESQGFVWNGRNAHVVEEAHGFRSVSIDSHEKREVQALLSFKKHIKRDPSGKLSNWTAKNSKEVCPWYGITCTRHTRRVVAIILHNSDDSELRLGGTLFPSLGNLSLLQTLNLSGNDLTGGIPPEP